MKETQQHTHLIAKLLLGLLGILMSVSATAEQTAHIYDTQVHIDRDGLAIQQPSISQTEILNTLTQAHHLLTAQGQQAKTIVAEYDSGSNMLVAAIMPGGLIYLAYQQNKFENAQTTLSRIENELTDLDTDAVALYRNVASTTRRPILVARYP